MIRLHRPTSKFRFVSVGAVGLAVAVVALAVAPRAAWPQDSGGKERADSHSDGAGDEGLDALSKEKKKRLLELMKSGRNAYSNGAYGTAIAKLKKARQIYQNPEYLYRIAVAYQQNGERRKAVEYYEKYLDEKPESDKREDIERRVASLEDQLDDSGESPRDEKSRSDEASVGGAATPMAGDASTSGDEGSRGASNTFSTAMFVTGGVFAGAAGTFAFLNLDRRGKVRELESDQSSLRREETEFNSAVREQNLFAGMTYGSALLAAGALTWGIVARSSDSDSAEQTAKTIDTPRVTFGAAPRSVQLRLQF